MDYRDRKGAPSWRLFWEAQQRRRSTALLLYIVYFILSDIGFGAPRLVGPRPALEPDMEIVRAYLLDAPSASAPPAAGGQMITPPDTPAVASSYRKSPAKRTTVPLATAMP